MISVPRKLETNKDLMFLVAALERAIKEKNEFSVSIIVTRLENLGFKVVEDE